MPLRRVSSTLHRRESRLGPTRAQGITLVEVATSGFVLAILSAAVAVTLGTSLRRNAAVAESDHAREAARAKLEEIVTWPNHDEILARFDGTTFSVGILENPAGDLEDPDAGGDPGVVTIDATNPDLLVATVRVDWMGTLGDGNLELRTLLTRRLSP